MADAADMMGIEQVDDGDAAGLRHGDGTVDSIAGVRLAERDLAVDDQEGRGVDACLRLRGRAEIAVRQRLEIERQHADAVAVMAAEIGEDEMIGGLLRFGIGPAGLHDHVADEGMQRFGAMQTMRHGFPAVWKRSCRKRSWSLGDS